MPTLSTLRFATALRRYAVCVAVIAATLVAFPLLALTVPLPRIVGNVLFFWPQYLLVPSGFLDRTADTVVFRAAIYAAVPIWLALVAVYVAATRRAPAAWVAAGVVPFVLAMLQLVVVPALTLAGLGFVLDGP